MSTRIDPRLSLTAGMRRILAGEIGNATASLETARADPDVGIHQARKSMKRIRALLSLMRGANGSFYRAENARYRDISASLAGARDATALVETVDRFLEEFPAEAAGLKALRERLAQRRALPGDEKLGRDISTATERCGAGAKAAARFRVNGDMDAAETLADGMRRALKRGRRATRAAAASGAPKDFHDLRKAVKMHAAHLSFLADVWPRRGRKRREAADRLGTALGDLNDLAVISALIENAEEPLGTAKEMAALRKLIRRKRKSLSRDTLAAARDLFEAKPKKVAARLADAWREAAKRPRQAARLPARAD